MPLLALLLPIFITLFSGCSGTTTAFDFFKMDLQHEKAISNLRTGTIVRSFETEAIISVIYLNNVLPEEFNATESFYVSLYLKDDKRIYYKPKSEQKPNYTITLNGKKPIKVSIIDTKDRLRSLMPIQNEWNRYYLVEFEKVDAQKLTIELENDRNDRVDLEFQKESQ